MCLLLPAKVIEINKNTVTVNHGGEIKQADHSLVDSLDVDDYVLIQAGFIVEKLDKKSAEESLKMIENNRI